MASGKFPGRGGFCRRHAPCLRPGMRVLLLVWLTGCSTALSAIKDPEVDRIHCGMTRDEVEKIVGRPDDEEPSEYGVTLVYHVRLGRPERKELNTNSLGAAGAVANGFSGAGDMGAFAIIPLAIVAATFVVAEGINCGIEIHRIAQGRRHDVRVTYDADGRVLWYRILPHG